MSPRTPFIPYALLILLALLLTAACAGTQGVKPDTKTVVNSQVTPAVAAETKPVERKKPVPSILADNHQESIPYDFLPDNDMGRLLRRHFQNSAAFGASSEGQFIISLQEIRKNGPEVIKTLQRVYGKVDTDDYFARWLIVNTLTQLESEHTLAALSNIAQAEIPPEKFNIKNGGRSSVEEEVSIRLAAIRGLSSLARKQNSAAEDALIYLVKHGSNNALKTMSVQGYLGAGFDRKKYGSWAAYQQSPEYTNRQSVMREILPDKFAPLLMIQPVQKNDLDAFKSDLTSVKTKPGYQKSRQPDRSTLNPAPKLDESPGFMELKRLQQIEGMEVNP